MFLEGTCVTGLGGDVESASASESPSDVRAGGSGSMNEYGVADGASASDGAEVATARAVEFAIAIAWCVGWDGARL